MYYYQYPYPYFYYYSNQPRERLELRNYGPRPFVINIEEAANQNNNCEPPFGPVTTFN